METKPEISINITMVSDPNKNLYNNFEETIQNYENNTHYASLMCMKDTASGPKPDKSTYKFMENVAKLSGRENLHP